MPVLNKTYFIGIPMRWEVLIPSLQHSIYEDAIMEYQFEPLVRIGEKGIIEPLSAKSWKFSGDYKILRFKIDTSRRFSDGSNLCAMDFKRSWEEGLRMESKSANSSLADGLGNLKGYGHFKEKGEIEGIKVIGKEELELIFEKPVRIALVHLSGGRFSAYKKVNNRYIGTGPYVIDEKGDDVILTPNIYYTNEKPKLSNVTIRVVSPDIALEKLKTGEIDAYLFSERLNLLGCEEGKLNTINCVNGQEASHAVINLNGLEGRFFYDSKHRLGFQTLIWKNIDLAKESFKGYGFIADPQSFLKFQAGRIADSKAEAIIRSGEKYINRFIKATHKQPLYLVSSNSTWGWLKDFLVKEGVKLTENSNVNLNFKDNLEMYYKTFKPDIRGATSSVADGDPDGLYHLLGRNGAIFSPMMERKKVCDGMERGRKILDPLMLPAHYKKVSEDILKEVPYVHLGYFVRRMAYNGNRLKYRGSLIGRNSLSIMSLEPK
ncbi:MAG: ABC transporter substrate-binding protein [Elusimicrobiota bacterium]